jgi:hypothetical protein
VADADGSEQHIPSWRYCEAECEDGCGEHVGKDKAAKLSRFGMLLVDSFASSHHLIGPLAQNASSFQYSASTLPL